MCAQFNLVWCMMLYMVHYAYKYSINASVNGIVHRALDSESTCRVVFVVCKREAGIRRLAGERYWPGAAFCPCFLPVFSMYLLKCCKLQVRAALP